MALFGTDESFAALVARARDQPPADGSQLAALLERIVAHPAWRPSELLRLLGHHDARIRAFGASWLASHAEAGAVEQLVRELAAPPREPGADVAGRLAERLPRGGGAERELVVGALRRLADRPEVRLAERLMPLLADEDARVREAAVELLGQMPDAAGTLRSFLVYSRGLAFWLRERAAASIAKIQGDIMEPLGRLMQDPEEDIRIGALVMAAASRDPRIVPRALEIFLGRDDWWVRSLAAEVLGHFPSPEVTRALRSRLDDTELRSSVIAVLAKMEDAEAVGSLVRCLADPDRGTRRVTLEAIAAVKRPEFFAALLQVALGDPDPSLRDKAVVILESHRPATEPQLAELSRASVAAPGGETPAGGITLTMENDEAGPR